MYACRGFACRSFKERLQNLNVPALVLYMSASLNAGNVAQYVHKNMGRVRHLGVFYTECLGFNCTAVRLWYKACLKLSFTVHGFVVDRFLFRWLMQLVFTCWFRGKKIVDLFIFIWQLCSELLIVTTWTSSL